MIVGPFGDYQSVMPPRVQPEGEWYSAKFGLNLLNPRQLSDNE